jgi:hypothetical protein
MTSGSTLSCVAKRNISGRNESGESPKASGSPRPILAEHVRQAVG